MQNPVKERIAKLRDEIAQISEADRLYSQGGKKLHGATGITNGACNGCRKSWTSWWRSQTGKSCEDRE
jgi:hypothetical protein